MEEADADVRSLEDHVATVRLRDEDGGGVAMAAAADVGDGLGDDKACGARGRCLSTEEDEGKDKGCELVVKLADSLEAISAPFEVTCHISEEKGSAIEERHIDMEEQNMGCFPAESAECGNLLMCHAANGGLSSKTLCVTCGETSCSKDVSCVCDTLDKATERQYERESLAGNEGNWGGMAEVKASIEDLQMVCEEAQRINEGLSGSMKHDSEQWSCGVDGVIFMTDDNFELKQDDLMPKIEVKISGQLHEDSVPSVYGSINVSLDGKAGCVGELFGDSVARHVADGGVWNKGLCAPFGEESQSKYSECMHDMVDKVTESQCEEGGLADGGVFLCDGVLVKTSLDGPSLMADAGDELETDGFLPNIDVEVSCPVDEAPVPSMYKSPKDAPLDGKAGWVCEISENRSCVEKFTEVSEDGTHHSRMEISKWLPLSTRKDANMVSAKTCGPFAEIEVPLQQADQKSETFEFLPERDPTRSSYNQPCEDALFCTSKESSALCLGHQDSSSVELGSLDHLAQELNTCNSVNDKLCSADFVKTGNDGELQSQMSEPLMVFRRRNPRRAASSRNCNLEKHDQMNKGINSTLKSKKVEGLRSLVQSSMFMFPNKTTKGRSGINRPLKSTAWGSLQKLTDGFSQNCGPSTSNSHHTCLEMGRSNKRPDEKKQQSIRKTRSSRCSKNKRPAFSDMVHSTDEFNRQHTFSVTDTKASSEGHIGNFRKLAPHALVKVSDDAPITTQCMSMQTDTQQFGRCLGSITREVCPAYIHGECAKSTSEPSLNNGDVGFSPDSVLEVASVTCENNTSVSHDVILHESLSYAAALTGGDLHASALSTYFGKSRASSSTDLEQRAKTVRGDENTRKEEINPPQAIIVKNIGEGKLQGFQMSNALRNNKKLRKLERQKKDGTKGKNLKNRNSTKISSVEDSKLRALSNDSSELLLCTGPPKFGSCLEVVTSATQDVGMHEHDSMQDPFVTDKVKWCGPDNVKSPRCKKKDDLGSRKGKVRAPHVKGKGKKKNIADDIFVDSGSFSLPSQLATDLVTSHTNEQITELAFKNSAAISTDLPRDAACKIDGASVPLPHRAAWVCCDDCQKWRCIPAELADIIGETNCRWTCKDNRDKAFADCSITQEKTNAEINTELELSDASADEADNDGSNSKACEAPSWTHVKENSFSHRNRRKQSIDESMVCNCKPPQDGRMGCRDGCLNRMLNIECEKRTCPCGEQCSNQQFQRRNYANISWFRSGKKGYGLQLQEEVSEGHFLIEYVGEVLDITTYESRQRYYASKGQKHFYFMALNGGEVIDACTKGNLGRFINHSCGPNCRTEKWMVNGEVCIGIFAMRNIKKGEELTFDYNYVRVSGAAPQKCFCGTAKCRGYIGGEISGSHIIAQDDAEAENFEPMTVDKDAEEMLGNVSFPHDPNPDIIEHGTSIPREDSNDCPPATPETESHQQISAVFFDISEPENSLEALSSQDAEDVTRTPVHVSRTIESSLPQFPAYDTQPLDILHKYLNTMDGSRAPSLTSGSTHCSDLGSNLVSGFHANKKNNLKHHRNVKPSSSKVKPSASPIDNEHTLGVEGRLNNLLDEVGGIRARKDAAKGYLKLLLVTAAEGDNAGGTSKSVRDISLILDALLKTKSNAVLLDVISKNGLQMLQNILKQNRSNFLRTPIIRKLLKVLEFLVLKDILTPEDINGGPRCAGMESFRDSMLSLIWHRNPQVQQIARNFRDKWITPNVDGPVSKSNFYTYSSSSKRKRKSRWDYQPESHYKMIGLKIQKVFSGHGELDLQTGFMKNKSHGNLGTNPYHNYVPVMGSSPDGADDEVPPGFEPRQECRPAQASLDGVVAPGFCQERYLPNLNISYGIPVALVHRFGTPEVEGGQCGQKWKVAPGVPFIPFPPLPPYPRGSPCPSTSSTQMSHHDGTLPTKHNSSGYQGRTVDRGGRVLRCWRNEARPRFPYSHQGRRFPSSHHRFERCQPPRPQEHGDSGFRGRE